MNTLLLREAMAAHERGAHLIPLAGKVPTIKDWTHAPRQTEAQIREWAARGNIGIRTGTPSGIVVIDADPGSDVAPLNLPETWTVITGRDGRHFFFAVNGGQKIGNSAGRLGQKIDVRGEGGQVVIPGSVHPDTGRVYTWAPDLSPDDIPLAPLPDHLAARLAPKPRPATKPGPVPKAGTGYGAAALGAEVYRVRTAPEYTRNATLNTAAFSLGQLVGGGVLDRGTVEAELHRAALEAGLEEGEIAATIKSGIEAGMREPRGIPERAETPPKAEAADTAREVDIQPREFPITDAGNGELIAALYSDRLRFDHRRGRWLLFGPHHWREDALDGVRQLAKDAARARYADALNVEDAARRKAVSGWALRSEARGQIDSALTMARSETPIADTGERWDADHFLIGVLNGVIDLKTGKLRAGRKEDRITMAIPISFDPEARAPRWGRFLEEVFAGDTEMISFVHRAAGYSLTGDTREQCLFLCHGGGGNGKSVLLRAVRETFGPYAADTPFSTLELSARASIPSDVAALAGKRIVTAGETSATSRLNEARIKALTGGDAVTARFMYAELFTFRPEAKFWLAANHLPRVLDTSRGFWRRVRLIPFLESFDPATEPDLEAKLRAEQPGILTWATRGALEWQAAGGLRPPASVTKATAEYQAASDPLGEFLADCTATGPAARVKAGRLYLAYSMWARTQGLKDHERLGSRLFGEEVSGRFDRVKDRAGLFYISIELNNEGIALADKEQK